MERFGAVFTLHLTEETRTQLQDHTGYGYVQQTSTTENKQK